jgi:hypothetical protein
MITRVSKSKRPKSRSRGSDRSIRHIHVVVDDVLHTRIEAHARKLEGIPKSDVERQPNLSAAIRDLLRSKLGLPGAEAA